MIYDRELLLYRRQFVLCEKRLNRFPTWKHTRIGGDYFLEVHPDLNFHQTRLGDLELTLVGYIIDPYHPDWTDQDVLQDIITQLTDKESIFEATNRFGGRWILFLDDGDETLSFTDPCGLRSLFFSKGDEEPFMCASQPGMIATIRGLEPSDYAKLNYLETAAYKDDIEYWLPGGASVYYEIAQLLPNHCLNLNTRKQKRFWPWDNREALEFEAGINQASKLLEKMMLAAINRFPLAATLTAGFDTRAILAASRTISHHMYFYTMLYYNLTPRSPDVDIPKRVLAHCGLEHHILDCSGEMDEEFRDIYMQNVDLAHEAWGHIACGLYHNFSPERVSVKGVCSEIARMTSSRFGYVEKLDGKTLAEIFFMEDSKFAVDYFEKWVRESLDQITKYNYRPLDLFYWEHKLGSWQATSQLEWDIVQETFSPFNCRELLVTLLSVDENYRRKPAERLMRGIMTELWPIVLEESLNPRPLNIKLRKRFRLIWRSRRFKTIRTKVLQLLRGDQT